MSSNGEGGPGSWRDPEFGHGQERYYGSGQVSGDSPDGRSTPVEPVSRGGLPKMPILVGAGVLAVALAAGGVYLAAQQSGGGPVVQPPSTAAGTGPVPQPTARARPTTTTFDPTKPQENDGGESDHALFEVPPPGEFKTGSGSTEPIWRMHEHPRDQAGYASLRGKNISVGYAPTFYRDDYCKDDPNEWLGVIVWEQTSDGTVAGAAKSVGDAWLKSVATKDDGTVEKYDTSPSLESVTLGELKTKAVQFRGKTPITSTKAKKCGIDEAEVVVTVLDTGKGISAVVLVRLLGHPDSMSDKQVDEIFNSLRPKGS